MELASKFGFEKAEPKSNQEESKTGPLMVNSSSGKDSGDEIDEKEALVKRIQAMTADEEEDPFD